MSLTITQAERQQYQQHFLAANPINGRLPGNAAREILLQSGLPTQQLGEIWELADIDKDGALDFDEYCIAIKLVYSILGGAIASIPQQLPPTLIPQTKYQYFGTNPASVYSPNTGGAPSGLGAASDINSQLSSSNAPAAATGTLEWYVSGADRAKYQGLFSTYARGGSTIRLLDVDEFLSSLGIPRTSIMQVWSLVDVRKYQQLNQEQFIYLLHALNAHTNGARIPATLPPAVKDIIYKSLNLDSASSTPGASSSHGYKYGKVASSSAYTGRGNDPKKPGLYGEKSGNVALADSYLSKLKTSSTFKNEAGSRYASSSKNAEEEKKLKAELSALDKEAEKLRGEAERQTEVSKDEELLESTVAELESLRKYKLGEKQRVEAQSQASASGHSDSGSLESLQNIKQSIFDLEGHLSFLRAEKSAIDEFIASGRQELVELQMEQMELK